MARRRDNGPEQITRARWQLWATTFLILGSLTLVLVFISSDPTRGAANFPLPAGTLRISLIGLMAGFVLYAVDRERNLHVLSGRLQQREVERARMGARLESLAQLERERDTNAALLDGSADGIAVVDADLRLVRVNGAMRALCGIPAHADLEAFAPALLRFASPAGEPLLDELHPLARALADGQPRTGVEMKLRLSDGTERWVSGTFSPIRDGDVGPVALVLVTARDISSAKEMEDMQRDFVSIVSHELRTPLTAIKGFAKTLMQRNDSLPSSARREYLATVNEQADRLTRLVEDLLQVSRIDAKRLRVEREGVNIAEMVKALATQFATKWAGREVLIDPDEDSLAWADRRKIEEILINLLDNAIKYSPAPEPVTVHIRNAGDMVEIQVEDSGFGIAPDDIANLFQKFQRVASPATRDIGGTGLGLYIVKGLVEAQGGHVWVESVPGAGSTFGFTLPAARVTEDLAEAGA